MVPCSGIRITTANVPHREGTSYIGREHDNETDLGFYGVRLYEPEYGRFLSTDVLWEKYLPLQPYQYALNQPISQSDCSGREAGDVFRTLSEAANDWVMTYGTRLSESGYEYASAIGEGIDHNGESFFVYNEPRTMNSRIGSTPELLEVSESTKSFSLTEVAWIHNHPSESPGDDIVTKPNELSRQDVSAAENRKIDVFALVPNGQLLRYSYLSNKVTVTKGPQADDNEPESKVVNHGGVPDMTVPRRTSGTD
jgi:RHS repeat-associated protein